MPGAAERTISVQYRGVVDELKSLAGGTRPSYAGSSAFRFAIDRSAGRAVADVSAVALEAGVLLRAVQEETLRPPDPWIAPPAPLPDGFPPTGANPVVGGPAPGAGGPGGDPGGAAAAGPMPSGPETGGGRPPPDRADAPDGVVGARNALLTGIDSAAAKEKAVLGCRALERGWFEEATEIFLEGASLLPTDPFAWFGAGLAASRFDQAKAADHLARASRYLGPDDPAGAAYVAIVAAALLEEAGDVRAARQLLQRRVEELNITCPTISLHLARLGPVTSAHVSDALLVDPLLDVDVTVLGLDPEGESLRQRRQRTEHELSRLAYSIGELRKVGGGGQPPDPEPPPDDGRFLLAGAEIQLWRKISACQREIERARFAVEEREAARREKERELTAARDTAAGDLDIEVALPFFASCVVSSGAVVAAMVTSRLVAGAAPSLAFLATAVAWVTIVGLVVLMVLRFVEEIWPRRNFSAARDAKGTLAGLEWDVSQLRNEEFEARRRFERARQDTELRIRRIIDHRRFVVPRRPAFAPTDHHTP